MSKPKQVKDVHVPDEVLLKLLTPSEIRMLKNRWQIVKLLQEGLSVRKIANRIRVGTDTVVRMARMVERNNLRKVINDSKKLTQISPTSWIFGKSNE